jgi:predicted O-methyltransferase YrrM
MPLLRAYDAERDTITVSVRDAYLDRLYRYSDIRDHLPFLREQAAVRDKPQIAELGTRTGNSTLAFLDGASVTGGHVWSVDIEDILQYPDGMKPWAGLPSWTFVHGDSLDPEVQASLPQELDILFNDASHEYLPTLEECRRYVPMIKPGGLALFHDTKLLLWSENGITWSGSSDKNKNETPPVRRALDDYCAETGLAWEEMDGEFGLGVIRL